MRSAGGLCRLSGQCRAGRLAELGAALLEDPRVTALGLYVEGVDDTPAFAALAEASRIAGKGIVALQAANDGDAVDGYYGVGGFGRLQELPHLNKPVIAAVNGICCGRGLDLALSCDLILASDTATFALPEIRSGKVADAASIKLPKRIPYHVAMDLLLTVRWFDAEEAQRWGLIHEICAPGELLEKAWDLARLLESGPPLVYAAIKEVVREAEHMRFQDALNRITKRQFTTVDTLSIPADPRWKGR